MDKRGRPSTEVVDHNKESPDLKGSFDVSLSVYAESNVRGAQILCCRESSRKASSSEEERAFSASATWLPFVVLRQAFPVVVVVVVVVVAMYGCFVHRFDDDDSR